MAVEIAGISIDRIHGIYTDEKSSWVQHHTPGLDGDIQQNMGRALVKLRVEGIFYGPEAVTRLTKLRKVYLEKEPVDFLAEITDKSYFAQVIISNLLISQQAAEPDQINFAVELFEFVPPPKPQLSDFASVDASIVSEAAAFMDGVKLPDLMGAPDIQNPLPPVEKVLDEVKGSVSKLKEVVSIINKQLN